MVAVTYGADITLLMYGSAQDGVPVMSAAATQPAPMNTAAGCCHNGMLGEAEQCGLLVLVTSRLVLTGHV
jgi:hypothetical protein